MKTIKNPLLLVLFLAMGTPSVLGQAVRFPGDTPHVQVNYPNSAIISSFPGHNEGRAVIVFEGGHSERKSLQGTVRLDRGTQMRTQRIAYLKENVVPPTTLDDYVFVEDGKFPINHYLKDIRITIDKTAVVSGIRDRVLNSDQLGDLYWTEDAILYEFVNGEKLRIRNGDIVSPGDYILSVNQDYLYKERLDGTGQNYVYYSHPGSGREHLEVDRPYDPAFDQNPEYLDFDYDIKLNQFQKTEEPVYAKLNVRLGGRASTL